MGRPCGQPLFFQILEAVRICCLLRPQFVGLRDLSPEDQEIVQRLSTEYYEKIRRDLPTVLGLTVHIKCYEKEGKRKQRGSAKRRRVDEADEKQQRRRDERDLEELKRDALVVALRKRGLRTTGAKAVLLKRLQDAIRHDNDDDDDQDDDGNDGDGESEQEKPRPAAVSEGVTKRRLAKRTNRGTNK